jgi:orotate phosphoribosyltransferase
VTTLTIDPRYARPVAECLLKRGAFTVDLSMPRAAWFRWKSGITAPCGCDCRRLNAFPEERRLIDDAMAQAVRDAFPDASYIVGVAQAGIAWGKSVAERLDLPLAYVRAQPRALDGPRVEGMPRWQVPGRAVVIEDVVASGASTHAAIQAIEAETELTVDGVTSIANWDFPEMKATLGAWPTRALTGYPYLLDRARHAGLIDDDGLAKLTRFYQNPRDYTWDD